MDNMDNYESKILSYTSDIERLQAQIKELQKQKQREQELTELEKYTPGPNMMVMTKWLDGIQKYRENMKKMLILDIDLDNLKITGKNNYDDDY